MHLFLVLFSYQSDQEEAHEGRLAGDRGARDVTEAHGGHGHHHEVDAVPVAQMMHVGEVRRVSSVLQLEEVMGGVCVCAQVETTYRTGMQQRCPFFFILVLFNVVWEMFTQFSYQGLSC